MDGLYFLLGIFLLIGAVLLGLYLLQAYALYRMSRRAGLAIPGLAWIPFCQEYVLGWLCDRSRVYQGRRDLRFRVLLPVLAVLSPSVISIFLFELLSIPTLTDLSFRMGAYWLQSLIRLAGAAGTALGLYFLYRDYAPGQEGIYTVLSVVIPFGAAGILLFTLRERLPLSQGGKPPQAPVWQGPRTTGPGQSPPPPPPGVSRPRRYNDPKGHNRKK